MEEFFKKLVDRKIAILDEILHGDDIFISGKRFYRKFARFKNFVIRYGKREYIRYVYSRAIEEFIVNIIYNVMHCEVATTKIEKEKLLLLNYSVSKQTIAKTQDTQFLSPVCSYNVSQSSIAKTQNVSFQATGGVIIQ